MSKYNISPWKQVWSFVWKYLKFLYPKMLWKDLFFSCLTSKICTCKLYSQTHTRTDRHRQTDGRTDNFQFRWTCRAQFVLHAYLSIYVSFNCRYAKHIDACNSTLCKIKTCIVALLTNIVLVFGTWIISLTRTNSPYKNRPLFSI